MTGWVVQCNSVSETDGLAVALAKVLVGGIVIGLVGNLGSGKTRFVQGLCSALDVDPAEVTSPTFVLIQEYAGRLPIYHLDTYRLHDADEFDALGISELFDSDGVSLVEWADRFPECLPMDVVQVSITAISEQARRFQIVGSGQRSTDLVEKWRAAFATADGE
ncbi:MAG: tRNA (adenosine(37)-N6)-threonylcarbamoyltransferase complex ATPase subunit type 1 TsaE [Planctomycetota bacterium]|nr:tRNA (adenosine(37)-N6)-threonylcarbamoyltransferase complex ATPase subunit type 1 TsaE [Planctomycetota bacterium]